MKNKWIFFSVFVILFFAVLSSFAAALNDKPKWLYDYNEAKKLSKMKNVPILMYFTSGWENLEKELFSPEFSQFASRNLVLVKVDFTPGAKQSAELKKKNEKLKKDFKVTGYPYTIMLDLKGKEMISFYGHTGDPARVTYLKKIREVVKDSKVFMLKEDSNEKDKAPKKKPEEDSADEF